MAGPLRWDSIAIVGLKHLLDKLETLEIPMNSHQCLARYLEIKAETAWEITKGISLTIRKYFAIQIIAIAIETESKLTIKKLKKSYMSLRTNLNKIKQGKLIS